MKKFPRDCSRNCPHLRSWDLSIDDYTHAYTHAHAYTHVCTLLNIQIDDYDIGFYNGAFLPICPLEEIEEEREEINE